MTNDSKNDRDHTATDSTGSAGTPDRDDDFSPTAPQPSDLSVFDDAYAEAEVSAFDEVPDGRYQVRVHTVKLDRSRKNDPMIKWDTVIISGQYAGRHIFKNSVVTQSSLAFVKADLQTLGLKLEKLSDLPNRLNSLLDLTVDVTKRTKGEYENVYFNRLLNTPADDAGANRVDLSDEPIPF